MRPDRLTGRLARPASDPPAIAELSIWAGPSARDVAARYARRDLVDPWHSTAPGDLAGRPGASTLRGDSALDMNRTIRYIYDLQAMSNGIKRHD